MTFRRTSLYPDHEAAGATFTDFGSWKMPASFDSIRTEHEAVRSTVGKFDVSHMGQLAIGGSDAAALTQWLTTNDVTALVAGEGQYSAIVREDGVMLDDVVVYRLPAEEDATFLVVPNAGHDVAIARRFRDHRDERGLEASVDNRTEETAMIAIQGPEAADLLAAESTAAVEVMASFDMVTGSVAGVDGIVARTGYTGEDGFEVLCPWGDAGRIWAAMDCQACGLGARDTLRLEMGYLLSGQDFHAEDDPRTPDEAGIDFVVALDTEFVGRDALARQAEAGVEERLAGFQLLERGVPRTGYDVTTPDGEHLGTVTSGTVSPTLDEPIGLAYLPTGDAESGRDVRVVVRGEPKETRTRATPFLDR
jgi:aminomethyltransferase